MDMHCYIAHFTNYYLVFFIGLITNVAFLAIWTFPFGTTIRTHRLLNKTCIEFGCMASVMISSFTLGAF